MAFGMCSVLDSAPTTVMVYDAQALWFKLVASGRGSFARYIYSRLWSGSACGKSASSIILKPMLALSLWQSSRKLCFLREIQ